jgi:hypothetical protein
MSINRSQYEEAKTRLEIAQSLVSKLQGPVNSARAQLEQVQFPGPGETQAAADARVAKLRSAISDAEVRLTRAQESVNQYQQTVTEFENIPLSAVPATETIKTPLATNLSATDTAAAEKQATATVEGTPPTTTDDSNDYSNGFEAAAAANAAITRSNKLSSEPKKETPATPKFQGGKDHRVRLKVPISYVSGIHTQGPNEALYKSQGIIFPYTPSINQDYTANYSTVPVTHSNYTQYFYKNSSVGTISLTAKITVQNEYEAEMYFSIIHLLRALTKMRYGDDDNAGSPPPVCRLFAYGDAIMNNVPVAVSSFKLDLPDNVDYFTTKSQSSAPTMSTLTLTLTPIYSRNEMQKFTVTDWLSNNLRSKGYL